MLSQQKIKDNMPQFEAVSAEEAAQLTNIVLDSMQYSSNLQTLLANSEIADSVTRQTLADTIFSFVSRLLQSRTATSDCTELLKSNGLDEERSEAISSVISSRLDSIVKEMAEKSSGDKLTDLEWRFGLTAASNNGQGTPFIQMRLEFENDAPVSLEMGMTEFYEFAGDIKRIQSQMTNSMNL